MSLRWLPWAAGGLTAASAATLVYGCLVESKRLVLEEYEIALPNWPEGLDGYRIVVVGDFHVRDRYSVELGRRASELAVEQEADAFALVGDFVGYWKPASPWLLEHILSPLAPVAHKCVAIPGNHEYWSGDPSMLEPVLREFRIPLLRNEALHRAGVDWVGIDSGKAGAADPVAAFADLESEYPIRCSAAEKVRTTHSKNQQPTTNSQQRIPVVVLWHEPDFVDALPPGVDLMISGHSHGGQWQFPWGWTPVTASGGKKYVKGFYPDAPSPLFVTRGVGTTGPPARLGVLPEVAILTVRSVNG